jgi:prevent-host-death family protein
LPSVEILAILVAESYGLYESHIMNRLTVSEAREDLAGVVNRAAYAKQRTVVSRRGKDLAAIVPIEDLHLLQNLSRAGADRLDIEDARDALREAEQEGTIPLEELRRKLRE